VANKEITKTKRAIIGMIMIKGEQPIKKDSRAMTSGSSRQVGFIRRGQVAKNIMKTKRDDWHYEANKASLISSRGRDSHKKNRMISKEGRRN
jgi:hypothetical protein